MIEAVFISDLHLHKNEPLILQRFEAFIEWAAKNTRSLYILGDFFHAWPGDDAIDDWSTNIAHRLSWLNNEGVAIYYMHGNRDFLLGQRFANLAGFHLLKEPTLLNLNGEKILLAHGDQYCTRDKSHQRLRRLTRNRLFIRLFLSLPYSFREKVVNQVRKKSMSNRKSMMDMDVVVPVMIKHMRRWGVNLIIHGHTHQPGHNMHHEKGDIYQQYVLSDWDDNPRILCYDKSNRFYFKLL